MNLRGESDILTMIVLLYILGCAVVGVHSQLGLTTCTFATQNNCPNFLANSYCDINAGVCDCPVVAGYIDDGTGVACTYDCGTLDAPENGGVNTSSGTTTGDVATFSCDNGYTLNGTSTSTCVADIGWDNTATTCIQDCGTLDAPANGGVNTSSGTTTGDVATFSCDNGYTLDGTSTSTCVADIGWDNTATTCVQESTDNPTTTTETPFIKSTTFVKLVAGIGGVLAYIILCCVLRKCCCEERKY